MPDELMTVSEVAAELKINGETVKRWLRDGRLDGFILSDKAGWRVARSAIERFVQERRDHGPIVRSEDRRDREGAG